MPLISIIVPIYNIEQYLRQCINSVLDQSFTDYELILVDDGSPDNCGTICDEYAAKDKRIIVIHKENGGVSAARNAGLDIAAGEYIYFLDGDDFIDNNLLQTVYARLRADVDMLIFNYRDFHDNGMTVERKFHGPQTFDLQEKEKKRQFILREILPYKVGWEPWNRIYSRDIIEKYHVRYETGEYYAEDLYFFLCYSAHANKIVTIEDSLYNYRIRNGSTMSKQKNCLHLGRYNELGKALLAYFRKWDECSFLAEDFHTIHYMLVASRLIPEYNNLGLPAPEFREMVRKDIVDWDFFETQVKSQLRNWKKKTGFSQAEYYEQLCYMRYLLRGNYFLLRVHIKLLFLFYRYLDKENP